MMVECGAIEVSEEDTLQALTVAHDGIQELVGLQNEMLSKSRQEKMAWSRSETAENIVARVKELADAKIVEAINQQDKHTRIAAVEAVKRSVKELLMTEFPDNGKEVSALVGDAEYNALRSQVLDTGKRVDGRSPTEVRQITIDTRVLPRAHGCALFARGQTQALVAVTLGTANDVQRLDS